MWRSIFLTLDEEWYFLIEPCWWLNTSDNIMEMVVSKISSQSHVILKEISPLRFYHWGKNTLVLIASQIWAQFWDFSLKLTSIHFIVFCVVAETISMDRKFGQTFIVCWKSCKGIWISETTFLSTSEEKVFYFQTSSFQVVLHVEMFLGTLLCWLCSWIHVKHYSSWPRPPDCPVYCISSFLWYRPRTHSPS